MFEYRDRKGIKGIAEKYPEKTIILKRNTIEGEEINWREMEAIHSLLGNRFVICAASVEECTEARTRGIKFYHRRPATSAYEARGLINLGVEYIYVEAPLFFNLETIGDVKVRVYANEANYNGLPGVDGICGAWIRPEDVWLYEDLIDVIEFFPTHDMEYKDWLGKERALYRIYAEEHEWPGDIGDIINNINSDAVNRLILPDVGMNRLKCGQRCQNYNGSCTICKTAFKLGNVKTLENYRKKIENQE